MSQEERLNTTHTIIISLRDFIPDLSWILWLEVTFNLGFFVVLLCIGVKVRHRLGSHCVMSSRHLFYSSMSLIVLIVSICLAIACHHRHYLFVTIILLRVVIGSPPCKFSSIEWVFFKKKNYLVVFFFNFEVWLTEVFFFFNLKWVSCFVRSQLQFSIWLYVFKMSESSLNSIRNVGILSSFLFRSKSTARNIQNIRYSTWNKCLRQWKKLNRTTIQRYLIGGIFIIKHHLVFSTERN